MTDIPLVRRPNTRLVDVPKCFFIQYDHLELPMGQVVKWLSRTVRVEVTEDELNELHGCADYYSDCGSTGWSNPGEPYYLAIGSSARATCRMVEKLGEVTF